MADELLEFYGTECVHCREMEPVLKQLQKEEGITTKKLEVWHNSENAEIMRQYDKDFCGGVPFFYNTKTGKWICGSTSYEKLRAWAKGE